MTVLLIEPGTQPRCIELERSLEAMQATVGGYIQAIYPFDEPVALICNEEGKLLGLPLNRALINDDGEVFDIIAGTFFICSAPMDTEQFESLTPEQLTRYESRFRFPECFLLESGKLLWIRCAYSE